MNPGKYTSKIKFVDKVENDDGQGGASVTPADLIEVWASVLPIESTQALRYAELYNSQGYNVECRCLKTLKITVNHGILWDGKLLTIHSCDTLTDSNRIKIIAFE